MRSGRKCEGEWLRYHLSTLNENSKKALLLIYGEPSAVFSLSPRRIARDGEVTMKAAARFLAEQIDDEGICRQLAKLGGGCLTWNDHDYPALLREWYDPPMVLFYRGDLSLLQGRVVSVVGARKADPGASRHVTEAAKCLVRAGFVVGSGLAIGIDGAAHRGALAEGGGTVAVMGTGLDQIYPRFHHNLGEEIARSGLLLSEYAPGTPSYPANFPRRNRIIAGLSVAVLIAQASERSGASITGRLALEGNRDLFVLAAPPWDRRFAGNVRFALEGAPVVQDGDDLVVRLGGTPVSPEENSEAVIGRLAGDEQRVAHALGNGAAGADSLSRDLGLSAGELLAILTRLELEGVVRKGGDAVYHLNRKGWSH